MSLDQVADDIRSLKIQGARNVAIAAVKALGFPIAEPASRDELLSSITKAKELLSSTRPTEPAMRNALKFVTSELDEEEDIPSVVRHRINQALDHFNHAQEEITRIGKEKIRNGMIVFTHCHSSAVTSILKAAKKEGKTFEVHNTETRPLFQGRITAKELADNGIKVVHYVDSAARIALKDADLFLIGADAITAEGKVINKVGSELFAESAKTRGIPVYVCTDSWKFDPETVRFDERIEQRHREEVWKDAPANIEIHNAAFEKVDPSLITGVITELGILGPRTLKEEVLKKYSWLG